MWAIIELMGRQVLAGEITPSTDFPGLIQINVPATENEQSFTKIVNTSAIYAINPVTEETAKMKAEALDANPFYMYDLRQMMLDKIRNQSDELPSGSIIDEFGFNEDDFTARFEPPYDEKEL